MKIHFSKRYRHEHLFKHMINLSKMLFLLRQAEKRHKLREATHEIAQVDRTLISRRPQPLLQSLPRAASECQKHRVRLASACQGHTSVWRARGLLPSKPRMCAWTLLFFSKTQCLNLVLPFNANTCSGQAVLMEQQYGKQGAPRMLSVMHGQLSTIDCAFHRGAEKAQVNKEINLFRENAVPLR